MWRNFRIALLLALAVGTVSSAQQLDICGCKNNPATLGAFDTLNSATWPAGTVSANGSLQIPLPADGVMVFSSMNLQRRPVDTVGSLVIRFIRNAANTPVTLLVSGDLTIATQTSVNVSGDDGVAAGANTLGTGGNGGPGGSRGGDGAYQLVNFATFGGAGLGPAGGAGGTLAGTALTSNGQPVSGQPGTFVSASDLLPLVGGSGGGGGASTSGASNCAGGGGGGGAGALLIAVNGTVTINGEIDADGGSDGTESNSACSSPGSAGSGGAVRILANTLSGSGHIYARSGTTRVNGRPAANGGAIRMEVLNNNFLVGNTDPLATRTPGPGPLSNLVNPTVAITGVAGQAISPTPQGVYGIIDLVLPVPGATSVDFSTAGVPVGTTVNVTVKPRVGGAPSTNTILLSNCDANGNCLGTTSFNLAAGAYFVEARATFQTP